MANSKIIIVEGPQGAGKTTITDYIRNVVPYTNLYRLSGTSDSSKQGKVKAVKMYEDLMNYMENLENMSINLLFDRTFFTEEIYCRLGFKAYSFTDEYEKLLERLSKMDFEIFYITLYLKNTDEYKKRLQREGKANIKYAEFDIQSSINQQNAYLKMAEEIKSKYSIINVVNYDTSREIEITFDEIKQLLK
ncbi:MAG: hypothetical protein IKG14_02620 [Clostridia bacterium]|nr:hypothetical protein [Clostridia bacterium]MBR3324925.1 hypothetical protein [Clostridia bacterium]